MGKCEFLQNRLDGFDFDFDLEKLTNLGFDLLSSIVTLRLSMDQC